MVPNLDVFRIQRPTSVPIFTDFSQFEQLLGIVSPICSTIKVNTLYPSCNKMRNLPLTIIGAFPHTKKARFESRFKSRLFLRVSTQAEKSAIWIATIFYACPHTGRKIATQIAPVRASCACVLFVNRQRTQTAERPPCMMGYKKPVRFSFTVLTHFAQKIVAIIFKKTHY